jgi:formylglycine-generating enzyme required for sulfatase activity
VRAARTLGALVVVGLVASASLSQAQRPGGASTEPPPPAAPAPVASPAPPAGAPAEGEGNEGEHPSSPAPAPTTGKPQAATRQPAVLVDGMLRVPGGRFTMGTSDKRAPANERPARSVAVSPFWIDRTEVTVGAYRACVERGACARPPRTSPTCTFDLGEPNLPVSCVPWASANAYCLAMNKRLPREVEWENAARGTSAVKYPWGTGHGCGAAATLAGESTNRTCSGKRPSKVGAHLGGASPYGVLDMSGNVEEWVADWYADSVSELSPRAGASHVLRGGGWLSAPSLARTTSRNWGSVREAGPNVGFRCARDD